MIGIFDAISEAFEAQLSDNLRQLSQADRKAVEAALHAWFSGCRKRPTPDFAQRSERMMKRLSDLAASVEVSVAGGELSVSSDDSASEETLELVTRGSDWFEGCDDPAALVARALLG